MTEIILQFLPLSSPISTWFMLLCEHISNSASVIETDLFSDFHNENMKHTKPAKIYSRVSYNPTETKVHHQKSIIMAFASLPSFPQGVCTFPAN